MGVLQDDLGTFFIVMCSVLLRMRNVSDKGCRQNQNTHSIFINIFPKNGAINEICGKYSTARQATNDSKIQCMCFTCWITKATVTLKICNNYCPSTKQWLCEWVSMLQYKYIACPVFLALRNVEWISCSL